MPGALRRETPGKKGVLGEKGSCDKAKRDLIEKSFEGNRDVKERRL